MRGKNFLVFLRSKIRKIYRQKNGTLQCKVDGSKYNVGKDMKDGLVFSSVQRNGMGDVPQSIQSCVCRH